MNHLSSTFLAAKCSLSVILAFSALNLSYGAHYIPHEGASRDFNLNYSEIREQQILSPQSMFTDSVETTTEESILSDSQDKISPEFNIPSHLKSRTQFWFNVYGKYTSRQVLIYDEIHQDVIYEVVDLSDLISKSRNSVAFALNSRKRLFDRVAAYRKTFLELEAKRNPSDRLIAKNILRVTKSIRSKMHGKTHSFLELSDNLRLQTGHRDGVLKAINLSSQYLPRMEEIFERYGLPPELTRLTIVESSFNLEAVSSAGAKGIWQFLEASAQEYIHVDEQNGIDERRSPLKATIAAAQLLKRNRQLLPSWLLAVTAYHHGYRTFIPFAAVPQKIDDQIDQYFDPCNQKTSAKLGWASRNYYAQFLAVLYVEAYKDVIFGSIPSIELEAISVVRLSKGSTAVSFILATGVGVADFKRLNPDVVNLQAYLPEDFAIVLPTYLAAKFLRDPADTVILGPLQDFFKLDAGILAQYSQSKKVE